MLIILVFVSCKPGTEATTNSSSSSVSDETMEAAITTLAGAADESAGSSFAFQKRKLNTKDKIIEFFTPMKKAFASSCFGRARGQSCEDNTKTKSFDSCSLGNSNFNLSGTITLTYSDSSCTLDEGTSVTRSGEFSRENVSTGTTMTISSETHTDYRGESIGGGGQITNNGEDYSLNIIGKHKVKKDEDGNTTMDISVRTLSDVTITGGLSRTNRIMNGGSMEIINC